MSLDRIHYKKIEKLKAEILEYINNTYIREIREERLEELIKKWNKKNDTLDKISMSLAIEGTFKIENITKKKLDKEINIVLFEDYIEEVIYILKNKSLKIGTKEKINIKVDKKRLEVMIKDYLKKNIKDIFNNNIGELKGIIVVNNERDLEVMKIQ